VDPGADGLAARLQSLHEQLEHPPGVVLGVLRLPLLDPILDDLEAAGGAEVESRPGVAAREMSRVSPEAKIELERLIELISREILGAAPEAMGRRLRMVEFLRRSDDGRLPSVAFDGADTFGAELRAMLASDPDLRARLGRLYPLTVRATTVAPGDRWVREAAQLASPPGGADLASATHRVLASLLRAPIYSRPDLLMGAVRPANQRLARGLLWFASVAFPAPAEMLGAVGLRMGTSGRNDAVVRDIALANTCAALLGDATDPGAAAELASMRSEVTNRVVLKQVDRALAVLAARAETTVEDVLDMALPTFGLDGRGRVEIGSGDALARVEVTPEAEVVVRWHGTRAGADFASFEAPEGADPGAVAHVAALVSKIETAISAERRQLDRRLGSLRTWPHDEWRRRFLEHPIAGVFGRRLVWVLEGPDGESAAALVEGDGWIGPDELPVRLPAGAGRVRLWHPADAGAAASLSWRATLAARGVLQPIRQVDREVYAPTETGVSPSADLRFGGRIVDHARLRAFLRSRSWAVPALGAWDQGDEATGWRVFDADLRAELRYQAPDRVPTESKVLRARIVAVRFLRTSAAPTSQAGVGSTVLLDDVPRRAFSEAIRDVSLAIG
jgi:hypothetical protein